MHSGETPPPSSKLWHQSNVIGQLQWCSRNYSNDVAGGKDCAQRSWTCLMAPLFLNQTAVDVNQPGGRRQPVLTPSGLHLPDPSFSPCLPLLESSKPCCFSLSALIKNAAASWSIFTFVYMVFWYKLCFIFHPCVKAVRKCIYLIFKGQRVGFSLSLPKGLRVVKEQNSTELCELRETVSDFSVDRVFDVETVSFCLIEGKEQ